MKEKEKGNCCFRVSLGYFFSERRITMFKVGTMLAIVIGLMFVGVTQAAMYKYDDFSNTAASNSLWTKDVDSSNHGKVYFNDEDGDSIGVGVADIRMYTGVANKHAWIASNMTIDYAGSGDVRVTYDMKLYQDASQSYTNGFVLILPNDDRVQVTMWGNAGGGGNSHKVSVYTKSGSSSDNQVTSTALSINTWYHFDVLGNENGVVTKIYPYDPSGNNDPDWYVNHSTPRDTLVNSVGLGSGSYVMKFFAERYSGDDTSSNPRANIYVDNVFTNIPEPATVGLLSLGLGFLRRRK